mmetsp:Transcript_71451/g.167381  ORF Transcript_71451/g.167381 Transcript_71451/m.167381 type:complete len:276 (+) Transcript_71451:84-911(+)
MEVDCEALCKLLPVGRDTSSVEARERLFKEFVVRSARLIEMGQSSATKARSRAWNGTLNQDSLLPLLQKALAQAKILHNIDASSLECLVQQALGVAGRLLDPVSASDHAFVDMNQWHLFVFYFVTGLVLLEAGHWRRVAGSWTMALEDFRSLCQNLAKTRFRRDLQPEVVEKLEDWAGAPTKAVFDLEAAEGIVNLEILAEWIVVQQLPSWHSVEDEIQGRKRAFQLLQLMNNTPSLPNSVPGKLAPRNTCAAETPLLVLPPTVWQTTNRRFFSD